MSRPRGRLAPALLIAVALSTGVLSSTASADVLFHIPGAHVTKCMKVGVWYQDYSGGPRWARIQLRRHGTIVRSRRVRAGARWKYWQFCPKPGKYVLRYITPQGTRNYKVRVG